jgi:diguanylate cyclase (GGDEF)-like protein
MNLSEEAVAFAFDALSSGGVSAVTAAQGERLLEEARAAERLNEELRRDIADLRLQLEAQRVAHEREVETLRAEAVLEPMTGLLNRRGFDDRFAAELRRAERHADPVAVAIVDVDHFKGINDEGGHPFGDRVLKALAARLRGLTKREGDYAGRLGGEEFGLLFAGADLAMAGGTLTLLQESLKANPIFRPDGTPLTVSVGVVSSAEEGYDASLLMSSADEALYAAKNSGRNRILSGPQARALAFVDDVGQDEVEEADDGLENDAFAIDDVVPDSQVARAEELEIVEHAHERFLHGAAPDAPSVQSAVGAATERAKIEPGHAPPRRPQR